MRACDCVSACIASELAFDAHLGDHVPRHLLAAPHARVVALGNDVDQAGLNLVEAMTCGLEQPLARLRRPTRCA